MHQVDNIYFGVWTLSDCDGSVQVCAGWGEQALFGRGLHYVPWLEARGKS
jgi:hypothetical protein